jgi:hypothetical protein
MELGDCHDALIRKVLLFIRSVRFIKGQIRKGSVIDLDCRGAKAG